MILFYERADKTGFTNIQQTLMRDKINAVKLKDY